MKLDKFIISVQCYRSSNLILIVILGIIGLATLPVTQYPDVHLPCGAGTCHLYRCELHSCIEFGHRAVGRPDKRWRT